MALTVGLFRACSTSSKDAVLFALLALGNGCAASAGDLGGSSAGALGTGGAVSVIVGGRGGAAGVGVGTLGEDGLPLAVACPNDRCSDFPSAPLLVSGNGISAPPANAAARFGAQGTTTGGPCILEPEDNAMIPRHWLRPRVKFSAAQPQDLFEIRVHADHEDKDLVAYTRATEWYMPKDIWQSLSSHVTDDWNVTIQVRGLSASDSSDPAHLGTPVALKVAPAGATGGIVYWTILIDGSASSSNPGTTLLKGFQVGDENVGTVLTPRNYSDMNGQCIGCHTSTPDGTYVASSISTHADTGDFASAELRSGKPPNALPDFLTPAAQTAIGNGNPTSDPNLPGISQLPSFSKAHWTRGNHIMLAMLQDRHEIGWFDLEAKSASKGSAWGIIARNGDSRQPGGANWSHDGNTIVYSSANGTSTGVNNGGGGDLYTVPFNDTAGGEAKPLPGASDPSFNEYYPSFSPDDKLIAFTRAGDGETSYSQPNAEIAVIPASGGAAVRLDANTPPRCSGKVSPGITNSWPKWAPLAQRARNGKIYYYLIFSSTRYESGKPQLYMTAVVDDGSSYATYGAVYLWNQPESENNHTPAWDVFQLPPTPPPPVVH